MTNHLNSVQFINSETGNIVGSDGLILKTGNGGLTSAGEFTSVPSSFILEQNFPNPFNPVTVIRYALAQSNFVTLKIYDVLGKEVLTLVNEKQHAGNYEIEFNAENFFSGVYFYKIEAGDFSDVKRMLLIK
ncbi:MAG: T9SS type A sorting domain-containing protein [Ignavibacteria bacterium]|nr:T9SS type A sorting domain-containing protein [Ignavibacteria bacterium]